MITTDANSAESAYAADIDGDGNLDVLSASSRDSKIAWYENRHIGDSNHDGVFDSSDLIHVSQVGKYEDAILGNASFDEGDWNGDGDFDSADLILALQDGDFEEIAAASRADIAAAVDGLFAEPLHAPDRPPAPK